MSLLTRIQAKSKNVKTQYAFFGACAITGMIGIVWVSTLPARFTEVKPVEVAGETESVNTNDFGEILSETKNQLGNIIDWNTEKAPSEAILPEDSALGALNDELAVPPESVSTRTEPHGEIFEDKAPLTSPSPRVILIATTTDQKSE